MWILPLAKTPLSTRSRERTAFPASTNSLYGEVIKIPNNKATGEARDRLAE
jgi:hypothetical protein